MERYHSNLCNRVPLVFIRQEHPEYGHHYV